MKMLCVIIASLICFMDGTAIVRADAVQAIAADSFVKSIGVNVHWTYPECVYE